MLKICSYQEMGRARLESSDRYIFPRHVYILPRGGAIRGEGFAPIYYSDIVSAYLLDTDNQPVHFCARDIEYHFKNSIHGIRKFSFQGRSDELKGMIGYIPQDNILIEELTVFQNLQFNARLCLDGHTMEEINQAVLNLLKELDLFNTHELKVGSLTLKSWPEEWMHLKANVIHVVLQILMTSLK